VGFMPQDICNLFPEIFPYSQGELSVSSLHTLYYEECGNPAGKPVVFLHGGPGSGCNPGQRRFFDPSYYRIILFDQRGCGRSKPLGCIEENTTQELVGDLERLRQHLGIERWLVFGGSWGSTLALAYALAHMDRVSGLILRGIFLSRPSELDWFLGEARNFYPEAWQRLLDFLPIEEREKPLSAYAGRIFNQDEAISIAAAIRWNEYESSIMTLLPASGNSSPVPDSVQLARARVQLHYILHQCFVDGNLILQQAVRLAPIPACIVQGRYDMVCPPLTAWQLKQAMPHADFRMIPDAGHSAMESGTASALVAATESFKR